MRQLRHRDAKRAIYTASGAAPSGNCLCGMRSLHLSPGSLVFQFALAIEIMEGGLLATEL